MYEIQKSKWLFVIIPTNLKVGYVHKLKRLLLVIGQKDADMEPMRTLETFCHAGYNVFSDIFCPYSLLLFSLLLYRQALANALAAAPSMWTLGNAGMGALQVLVFLP